MDTATSLAQPSLCSGPGQRCSWDSSLTMAEVGPTSTQPQSPLDIPIWIFTVRTMCPWFRVITLTPPPGKEPGFQVPLQISPLPLAWSHSKTIRRNKNADRGTETRKAHKPAGAQRHPVPPLTGLASGPRMSHPMAVQGQLCHNPSKAFSLVTEMNLSSHKLHFSGTFS